MSDNPYQSRDSSTEAEKRSEKSPNGSCLGILALLWILPIFADIIHMFATARPVTVLNVLALVVTVVVGVALVRWILWRM